MAIGLSDQIERKLDRAFSKRGYTKSYRVNKTMKHRRERHRAKEDPECVPCYRKYSGWVW